MSAHSHSGETKMNSINRAALIASGSIFGLVALSGLCGLWTQNELQGALDESGRAANLIRAHMSADMMHDALRSDVLAAEAIGGAEALPADTVAAAPLSAALDHAPVRVGGRLMQTGTVP